MLNLDTTTALLKLATSSTADVDVNVSYADFTAPDTFTADGQNTAIVTATTTTICASPGAGIKRNIKGVWARNDHATTANTVTLIHTDGTTEIPLFKVTLAAGEALIVNDAGVPFVYDANGGVKMGASAASDTLAGVIMLASVAEMETGTDVNKAVTPGRQGRHPSSPKAWFSSGIAADLQQSYNITSLTDTGTGIVTVTIATDFAAATFCAIVSVEKINTTLTEANERIPHVRSASRTVTAVAFDCNDTTTTTNLTKDPTTWHVALWGDQ